MKQERAGTRQARRAIVIPAWLKYQILAESCAFESNYPVKVFYFVMAGVSPKISITKWYLRTSVIPDHRILDF